MKINDVTIKDTVTEQFYDWNDVVTGISSFVKNFFKPGVSWKDAEQRMIQDRGIQLGARGLIEWWKRIRYSVVQAYNQKNPERDDSQLESILLKRVFNSEEDGGLGAPQNTKIKQAVQVILDAGDNLNNKKVISAAFDIIAGTIGSKISKNLGTLNKDPTGTSSVQYGGPIDLSKKMPGIVYPVKVLLAPDKQSSEGGRFIHFNSQWYNDTAYSEGMANELVRIPKISSPFRSAAIEATYNAEMSRKSPYAYETGMVVPGEPGSDSSPPPNDYILQSPSQHKIWLRSLQRKSAGKQQ